VLWHTQHGATAETYRNTLAERGAPIPPYLIPPEPIPGVYEWFLAFWELSTERRFPGGPIPVTAIRGWPTDDPDTFAACIRSADAAYLAFISKPLEEKTPMEPLRPGLLKGKG